ncbi:hypothetical protein CHS0354_029706 [Potamilus streckersoni]|uniref:Purple acid phosphatase n=1 Tax=Potamilus streckersoni TaxID=2493646 RepID=A0AAE0RTH7_9BIVA|nr:hypothetical protein CHS0354_029706 [Potamilus streckersoni]
MQLIMHASLKLCLFFLSVLILVISVLCKAAAMQVITEELQPRTDLLRPEQIHISFGKKANDIVIVWATKANDISIVEYHTENKQKTTQERGETIRLLKDNEDGAQYLHRVEIRDLNPGIKYFYNVRGENDDTLSDQYSFTMPAVQAGITQTFMVYGDMGTLTKNVKFLVQETLNEKYQAVFHIGDIAYDLNRARGQIGDKFLNLIQNMAARTPYMTCPGDHERFSNFVHYRYRFSMPTLPWPMPEDRLWYSLDIGPIHFVIYNTEVFFSSDDFESQLKWLQNDLAAANARRSALPWIIAMGHRPMYCSVSDLKEDCTRERSLVRKHLEDLFYTQGVDLIISGHQHYYERTWPTYKSHALSYNYKEPAGPVHITLGSLGVTYLQEYSTKARGHWSAFIVDDGNKELFGRLKIYNATHLYWEVLDSSDNRLVDKIWIIQSFHRPFNLTRVFIPNPLGHNGEQWIQETDNDGSFDLDWFFGGSHYGDDYETRITVLLFVFIFLIIFLVFRKKILNVVRLCCFKEEPCKKLNLPQVNGKV